MEGDSQEEDETLRDYWTKKKEKKKEREKKRREKRSVSGEASSEDQEAQDKHETTLLDSTKLTTLTSVNEDKSPNLTPQTIQRESHPQHFMIQKTTSWITTTLCLKPHHLSHPFRALMMKI